MATAKQSIKREPLSKIGVFLCECGGKISSKLDLKALQDKLAHHSHIMHVETLPYPCLNPGISRIKNIIIENRLNRVVVAGCESRIMLKKLEKDFEDVGLEKGMIDVVNIRGHVAFVGNSNPLKLSEKGAKLIGASVEGLYAMVPTPKKKISFNGPVMVLGDGIATYSAAQELLRQGIETIIAVHTEDIEDEIRMLHERYPGERAFYDRLRAMMMEVDDSPLIKKSTVGDLEKVMGVVGDYSVTFSSEKGNPPRVFQVGAIIAALDGEMQNQGTDFGHDGKRVICHTEMEEHIWLHGVPGHKIVFWINDLETDRPYAHLSARTAWSMAKYIQQNNALAHVSILYNNQLKLPLSAEERLQAGELGIPWIPYDGRVRPTVQSGFITYYETEAHIEQELSWDQLVLSPKRHPGFEQIKVAQILGLHVQEGDFLERNPQMVRPEQVGLDQKFLAGSARKPCDLREALRQGKRAAQKSAEIAQMAKAGRLYAPQMVCTVDPEKCTGCGLCREICDCGGISPVEGPGGGVPRIVDPMICTGGGTCAAACPYQALNIQNSTTEQREARVAALAHSLEENEAMGIGCNWGGAAAADHAGLRKMPYDDRFHLLPVACIGQLDPTVMGRAFLEGANGLLLMGCPPEECHHSYGIDHTWSRVVLIKKLLSHIGLERERIALAHTDLNKPEEFIKTVEKFMAIMDRLGPIERDDTMKTKIRDFYDTLKNTRVRWVLGAGLRRPWETTYPADQRNALAYDETLSDILAEEFVRTRIVNLLKGNDQGLHLENISETLKVEKRRVMNCLTELTNEGLISRIFKDRTPHYTAW